MEYQDVIPVKVAANLVAKITYQYKGIILVYFINFITTDHFSAGLIIGGVDEEGPQVYSVQSGAVIRQKITSSGSGSFFIAGFMDANYSTTFNKQMGVEFVKTAISLAINRDNSSGGGVRIVDITKEGFSRIEYSFNELSHQN